MSFCFFPLISQTRRHIFGFWEVIVEVEVFDVSDETFSSWSGSDTVEDTFRGGDGGSGST